MDVRRFEFTDGDAHSYHNWSTDEPNNSSNTEDCALVFDSTGLWNDGPCGNSMGYVCEMIP